MRTAHYREHDQQVLNVQIGPEMPAESPLLLTVRYALFFIFLDAIMLALFNYGA